MTDVDQPPTGDQPPDGGYAAAYSETGLRDKLQHFASAAGREVVERGLTLYYTLQRDDLPRWARNVVIGALGYWIFPADAIPDLIPGAGYADDLGVLAAALATVAMYITAETRRQAEERAGEIFPPPNRSRQPPAPDPQAGGLGPGPSTPKSNSSPSS